MNTVLIIPAAGYGTRLQSPLPKVLSRVNGRPMLDYLLQAYRPYVQGVVLVVNPEVEKEVRTFCTLQPVPVEIAQQEIPTGMLDAILLAKPFVTRWSPKRIWITWCDQVAVHPLTIERLHEKSKVTVGHDLVFPTVYGDHPYIHFERNSEGKITKVLQSREGDLMPEQGESDMGIFSLSQSAYFQALEQYAGEVEFGSTTRERNFLPFIPWLQRIGSVTTFPAHHSMEALGINTPQDLFLVEQYLLGNPVGSREIEKGNAVDG